MNNGLPKAVLGHLLACNPNPDVRYHGNTPLNMALILGNTVAADMLIERGAKIANLNPSDSATLDTQLSHLRKV